jgi:hypothetical protein
MKYIELKDAPPWDLYTQLPDEVKAKIKKRWPSLEAYYKGFEAMHPITRELLERARKTKSLTLTLGYISHCFACSKHLGPRFMDRPGGGKRVLYHDVRTFLGYRNKRRGDVKGDGFFCEACAENMLKELHENAKQRNVKIRTINKCPSKNARYRKQQS